MVVKNKTMGHRKLHQPPQGGEPEAQQLNYERRFVIERVEFRAKEGSEMGEAFGYALKWGVVYNMGWYDERIDRNALNNADLSDVRILDNHESHLVLGRTKSNTAQIGIDETGLWYSVSLPESPNGQNMQASLKRGDIDQSSWGFTLRRDESGEIIGDKWEVVNGRKLRTITDVAIVVDASPVTFPANPDTSAAKRSFSFTEIREEDDDMEGFGTQVIDTPVEPKEPSSTWSIGWMADTVASAIKAGNTTVRDLNYLIAEYSYYAKSDTAESPIFQKLLDQCLAAKAAIIDTMNAHLDAMKELNSAENRSGDHTEKHETNTFDIAELLDFERRREQVLN